MLCSCCCSCASCFPCLLSVILAKDYSLQSAQQGADRLLASMQDLDLPADTPKAAAPAAAFAAPPPGTSPQQRWIQSCNLAPELVAAGAFDTAMRLLNRCDLTADCSC